MPWIGPAIGLAGTLLGGGGGGGGGGGNAPPYYTPTDLAGADSGWQAAFGQEQGLADQSRDRTLPQYGESFDRANALDWMPYVHRGWQAGGAYGLAGDEGVRQMGDFRGRAAGAAGAEDRMYGAAGHVLDTAFDPQNVLYARTAQRTQDSIRAGQAARGLGNSEVGEMEEAGAMANFNIDWENAQLGRQATGIQAAGGATNSGVNAGREYGADMSAAMGAGAAGAGYYDQAGQVPMRWNQQWAAAPGQAAGQYQTGIESVANMYGNVQQGAIPYMNYGQGAQQAGYQNRYQANRDMVGGMSQMATAMAPTVKDWFGGGGPQQAYNPGAYSTPGYNPEPYAGGDTYYGLGQNWGI